jgi:hypothetical protein
MPVNHLRREEEIKKSLNEIYGALCNRKVTISLEKLRKKKNGKVTM